MDPTQITATLAVVAAYHQVTVDSAQTLDSLIGMETDQGNTENERAGYVSEEDSPGKGNGKPGFKMAYMRQL